MAKKALPQPLKIKPVPLAWLYQALLAVLVLVGLAAYGADQSHATDPFTDAAKKAAAVPASGTGTTRFYGRDGMDRHQPENDPVLWP